MSAAYFEKRYYDHPQPSARAQLAGDLLKHVKREETTTDETLQSRFYRKVAAFTHDGVAYPPAMRQVPLRAVKGEYLAAVDGDAVWPSFLWMDDQFNFHPVEFVPAGRSEIAGTDGVHVFVSLRVAGLAVGSFSYSEY